MASHQPQTGFVELTRCVRQLLPRISVGEVTLRAPDGTEAIRRYLHTPRTVAIVAMDAAGLVLIREYRAAVGAWVVQVPMGKIDNGRDAPTSARTELAEETGFEADAWTQVGTLYSCPGWMDQEMDVFLATGLRPAAPATGDADDHEEHAIEVLRLSLMEFDTAVRSGDIRDARTIAAVRIASV